MTAFTDSAYANFPIDRFLDIVRCPVSGERLVREQNELVSADHINRYRLNPAGIPLFAEECLSPETEIQRNHYNEIAKAYTANLEYPHSQEYLAYLDRVTLEVFGDANVGTLAELCCGRGEALKLFGSRADRYVGIDISENMLEDTMTSIGHPQAIFLQADATHVPLAPESVDTVIMLGGIHHVPARELLFKEVARILKPGGRFLYREPVNDFVLWRMLRALIYRISPMLDHQTERPLVFEETIPVLRSAGLRTLAYQTFGFFGFCLFMNSDVLVFNRLFRFIPAIRSITRASAWVDEAVLAIPGLERAGLQVVGVAQKEFE